MRKIPAKDENFIDTHILEYTDRMMPLYKSIKLTPNILTTISLICNLTSATLFYYDEREISAIMFLIGYYFDCADGHFARKYDMVTKFGDYYDHFNDMFKIVLILFIMYTKSSCQFFRVLPLISVFGILCGMHIGCQELIYSNNADLGESPTLIVLTTLCGNKENINVTKYFGVGTFMVVFAIIMWQY